jgi:hypothetical protein
MWAILASVSALWLVILNENSADFSSPSKKNIQQQIPYTTFPIRIFIQLHIRSYLKRESEGKIVPVLNKVPHYGDSAPHIFPISELDENVWSDSLYNLLIPRTQPLYSCGS